MAEFKQITHILESFATKLVNDIKQSLKDKGHTPQGQSGLLGSIRFRVVHDSDNSISVQLIMDEYWRYINDGAKWRGKMPPSQQLIPWMAQRNINGLAIYKKKLKSGKTKVTFDKAQKGLAFAIAKSMKKKGIIKRFGYKGSQFFTSVIEDGRVEHLKTDLLNALGEDVAVSLRII